MFLKKMFGGSKPQTVPYFDAFFGLAMKLSRSLPLAEWATGIPQSYSLEEAESIEATRQARSSLEYTTASRHVEEPLQKLLCEIGLFNWAREERANSYDEWGPELPPENLESITSTFLKAWLCNSNPFVLLELADFLAEVGRFSEAREAAEVALKFPAYAKSMRLSDMEMVAQSLASELFPPGLGRGARTLNQGLYSPEAVALLIKEAESAQRKIDELESTAGERRLDDSPIPLPTTPTDGQLKEMWEAWQKDGEEGILNVFEKRREANLGLTEAKKDNQASE